MNNEESLKKNTLKNSSLLPILIIISAIIILFFISYFITYNRYLEADAQNLYSIENATYLKEYVLNITEENKVNFYLEDPNISDLIVSKLKDGNKVEVTFEDEESSGGLILPQYRAYIYTDSEFYVKNVKYENIEEAEFKENVKKLVFVVSFVNALFLCMFVMGAVIAVLFIIVIWCAIKRVIKFEKVDAE